MFYELIYTRCRQGLDITRKGHQISSDGYKVYSCTPAVMEEGVVDLQLLANVAQTKQSYTDPGFMDDAYLYYVPDTGASFLINFYPVPFDAKAQGDYSRRPGNFVNHALIGDFSQFYPYKLFQDDTIWNAKTKGEAYYYENSPEETSARSGITDPPGHYGFDEIGAFIADGREEALAKTVSFLIAQYKEEPEKRKYLVIRDDSSKNIELWIAAIECAFSPKIASSIPFATRMDKFVNTNRYTVKNGLYQTQMNLQDPNHKQRYRAMIVGVDERDKANVSAARPLANSPFVLLDGKQKQAVFEADTSNKYYQLITRFNDEHIQFCRDFLQTFSISNPGTDIYDLYDIFSVFNNPSLPNARTLVDILDRLNKYQAASTGIYKKIYERINKDISRFMQEDLSCALNIINWLQNASTTLGDTGAKKRLTEIVCKMFADLVFHNKSDNAAKRSYWAQIQRTEFAMSAAGVITDMKTIQDNLSNLKSFAPMDIVTFVSIYLESASLIGNIEQRNVMRIVKLGINICYSKDDTNSLHEIVLALSQYKSINSRELLFALSKSEDKGFSEFIIKYIINHDTAIIASDNSARLFCKKLYDEGLGHMIVLALEKRVSVLNIPSDAEIFIKTIKEMTFIGEKAMAEVFKSIDSRVSTSGNNVSSLAELLQTNKPNSAICRNSAHLFALSIISDNRRAQSIIDAFKDLLSQGFPTITDDNYIHTLVERLLKTKLSMEEQQFILDILFRAPEGYFTTYVNKLLPVAAKQQDKWNALFAYVSDGKDEQLYDTSVDCIVNAFVDSRQNKNSLVALGNLLKDENSLKFFDNAAEKALEIILSQKQKSGVGKFFGGLFGSGDDKANTGKKNK